MNHALMQMAPAAPADTVPEPVIDPALAPGSRLGPFELQRVLARSAGAVVYLAADHALAIPVAIQEYLPARLVRRDADQQLRAVAPRHDAAIARGLRAFTAEARMLARCDHPALVRVLQLFEANGTAYRVMPFYTGRRLLDLRRDMGRAPDEPSLRALLDGLLGALEALHRSGQLHGGVTPANILLLSDDRPLLLGPGTAGRETSSALVESLMASLETSFGHGAAAAETIAPLTGAAADLYALAEAMRYCITGELAATSGAARAHEPLAVTIAKDFEPAVRPHYSAALLGALDCAMSPFAEERPLSAAQLRHWLDAGPPRSRRPAPAPAAVDATTPPAAAPASAQPAEPPPIAATSPAPRYTAPLRPVPPVPVFATATALSDAPFSPDPLSRGPAALRPPAARRSPARRRWQQLVLGGTLAVMAAAVVAFATGAWERMPPNSWDWLSDMTAAVTAPAPAQTPPRPAPAVTPPPESSVAAPAATVSVAPPDAAPPAPATEPAADTPTTAAAQPPAPAEALAATPSPPEVAKATSPRVAAVSPAARAKPRPAAPPRQARNPQPGARPAAAAGAPVAACAGKTEFARYRCVQAQCSTARWSAHPQCVRFRASGEVD